MKWYNSIKFKLLGFYIGMSMLFLISLIVVFFFIREKNLESNAKDASTLATSFILQHIQISQTKAEEIVLALASIASKDTDHTLATDKIIPAILNTDKKDSINIASGGVWYEPYAIDKNIKNSLEFYNRSKNGEFYAVDYSSFSKNGKYRDMEFYNIAKKIDANSVSWTSIYRDPITHIDMITVVSPIYKNHTFVGTASVDIEIGNYNKKFWDSIEEKNMYLMIIDKDGNFIGKSNILQSHIEATNIYDTHDNILKPIVKAIKPTLINKNINHIENDITTSVKMHILENDPVFNQKSVIMVHHFPHTHWNIIIGIPKSQVMAQSNQIFITILLLTVVLTILATIIGYMILQKIFVNPIESINRQLLSDSRQDDSESYHILTSDDHGEIGTLVENLNSRTIALQQAQDREALEIEKRLKNEKMLIQQSKMAAMGEMMDAVAHQWKQPLNALSMYSEIIKLDFDEGSVDSAYITQFKDDIQVQIDHMVNTLDEFRTFFRPNKEHEQFAIIDIINSVLFLTKDDLLKNRINVDITEQAHIEIDGSSNEFKHLVLNIINNAKDAFNENQIERRKITIRLIIDNDSKRLEIEDNAGGIPESIIGDIFKANVTSKEEGKGTGIGLYMSTQIANKHHATLTVKNQNDGACFTISFHK